MQQRVLLSDQGYSSHSFASHLRESLLQDDSELVDEKPLFAETAAQICLELAYNATSTCRADGYSILCVIYWTLHGSQSLQNLGQSGRLLDDLATTTFTK